MATFTFGAGNARGLLRLPLYGLGALASFVVPRTPRLWVFGSGVGLGEGAVPLYQRTVEMPATDGPGRDLPRRVVWLASTEAELAEARALGFDAELKSGWRGFRLTLRARVLVVTHGFGDVNRFGTRGGYVVQLWHGIPLKKLHLDSPATLRVAGVPDHRLVRGLLRRAYRAAGRGISLFPVASELVADRIVSAFGIPRERIAVTGDVRDDVLLSDGGEGRLSAARARLETAVGRLGDGPVILYAPTWRDGAPDPSAPDETTWRAISTWLGRRDATLLVRAHPLGLGDYAGGPPISDRIRVLSVEAMTDVTPALPAVDALVTDYSSIAYDFAVTGGRIVFLAPDVEAYAKSRGLYHGYRDFSGGRHAVEWTEVLTALDEDTDAAAAHVRWLATEHVDRLDGRAADRVLARILQDIGEPVPKELAAAEAVGAIPRPVVLAVAANPTTATVELLLDEVAPDTRVVLDGARARVPAELASRADGSVSATIPMLGSRWGDAGLALPSGRYRVLLLEPGERPSARWDVVANAVPAAGATIEHPMFRGAIRVADGGLVVDVAPPLRDDERGRAAQRRLEDEYHRAIFDPEPAVFFESFYGRSASCNPLGIDRALARMRPDVTRYWSVVDASVPVPDGAVRVIEGSREWWRARGRARLIVVNDWMRKRWRRRSHQRVLQTWHGTMLKRLALDRTRRGIRTHLAVLRERDRWDLLLAQNSYAARVFRSAYAFHGPIWTDGYPRNDVLTTGDADAVRARLGVEPGSRVVLYAPTWRDDRTEMVDYLDLEDFAGRLDPGTVLLVRGHSRTLPFGRDLDAVGLVDVTTYPSIADLLLVADVLVTDYSSVMFDFAGTERPMVFFTPDIEHYSEDLRGFYFDLLSDAPGPVVDTREGLLDVLRHLDARTDVFAPRRTQWRERFAPHDDGLAGERVVRRLLEEGLLS